MTKINKRASIEQANQIVKAILNALESAMQEGRWLHHIAHDTI